MWIHWLIRLKNFFQNSLCLRCPLWQDQQLPSQEIRDLIQLIPSRWGTKLNQDFSLASASVTKAWVIPDEVVWVIHQGHGNDRTASSSRFSKGCGIPPKALQEVLRMAFWLPHCLPGMLMGIFSWDPFCCMWCVDTDTQLCLPCAVSLLLFSGHDILKLAWGLLATDQNIVSRWGNN